MNDTRLSGPSSSAPAPTSSSTSYQSGSPFPTTFHQSHGDEHVQEAATGDPTKWTPVASSSGKEGDTKATATPSVIPDVSQSNMPASYSIPKNLKEIEPSGVSLTSELETDHLRKTLKRFQHVIWKNSPKCDVIRPQMQALMEALKGISKPLTSKEVEFLASTGDYAARLLKVIRRVASAKDIKGIPRLNDELAKELKNVRECSYVDKSSNEPSISFEEEDGDDLEVEKSAEEAEQNGKGVAATKKEQSTADDIQECLKFLSEEEEAAETINLDPQTVEGQRWKSESNRRERHGKFLSLIPERYKEYQEHIVKMMEFYPPSKDWLHADIEALLKSDKKQANEKGENQVEEGSMLDGIVGV
ncbi:hypothetical protein BDW69DRAFT_190483 [Aspergillus filifer]